MVKMVKLYRHDIWYPHLLPSQQYIFSWHLSRHTTLFHSSSTIHALKVEVESKLTPSHPPSSHAHVGATIHPPPFSRPYGAPLPCSLTHIPPSTSHSRHPPTSRSHPPPPAPPKLRHSPPPHHTTSGHAPTRHSPHHHVSFSPSLPR